MNDPAARRASMRRDRIDLAIILIVAIVVRVMWMVAANATSEFVDLGEATHVALALAQQGQFADAYFVGQGATAHLLPVSVAIAGAIYAAFGYPAPVANLALAGWALVQTVAVFSLSWTTFRRLGMPRLSLRLALLTLAVSPAFLAQEAADFRVWEGALAVSLTLVNLSWLLSLDRRDAIDIRDLALAAILFAITFFVSPPAGLGVSACWGLFALRKLPITRLAGFGLLAASALAMVIAPWTLRNAAALGTSVLLRSNFGLELALANHPDALDGHPRADIFNNRVNQIHPFNSPAAAAQVCRIGEVAYADMLGHQAASWIAAHPTDFLRLSIRHYRQFYLPDTWQMRATIWRNWVWPRAIVIWLTVALGIAGLVLGISRRRREYDYLALYVAIVGLPYALVQPVPRYSYLIYGILTMVAADFVVARLRATHYRSRPTVSNGIAR